MSAPERILAVENIERYGDNDHHSVRADVSVVQDKTTGATNRLARLRKSLDDMDRDMTALFRRVDENRQELADAGLVAQHTLSPVLEAAYRSYLRGEAAKPGARVLTEVTEAPVGPEPSE